ncbi:haloacid dehalogenase-like hydrolase [Pseudomassariella vexata]|uniref:Haloacid dehalogenase-like hydrolase n=1 Tax=Pseudomassariella vexata TaxID=1141098 RepID=A0A1Y2E1N3_9PEZI|nr:haloacid dehalogenase-like hydrolase [Pseudomassariella vexata]ORY65463.1 haloacid dehalogenase-like hydrolase [Pseudomassariella vexata]
MRRYLSAMASANRRRFAPLKEAAGLTSNLPKLRGVVFDVDGTLCEPQNQMFGEMRSVLGIPKTVDILEHIYSLPTPEAQHAAQEAIRAIERRNMAEQVAQPGLATLMAYLDSKSIRKGICTRNYELPVTHLLEKFLQGTTFFPIVTRDFRPPKPDPAGILFISRSWGLVRRSEELGREKMEEMKEMVADADEDARVKEGAMGTDGEGHKEIGDASHLLMVGDSIDDMTAGRRAGAATVLLINDVNRHLAEHEHTDLVIERLDDLVGVLEEGFIGRQVS